jgi:hypothetical protein
MDCPVREPGNVPWKAGDRLNCVTVVQVSSGGGFIYLCLQAPLPLTVGDAVGCGSWGIRHGVYEVFAILGFCAASVGSFVTGISRKRVGPIKVSEDILTLDDGTDTVSRNVGNGLPTDTVQCPRGAKVFIYQWIEVRGCWDSYVVVLKIKMRGCIGRSRTRVQSAVSRTDLTEMEKYAYDRGSINVVHRVSTHLPFTYNKAYFIVVK